ncbi:hypothetical protein KR059_002532 [Drosophila kikkawai]|nr:hypothetical protein KR059_002532 [Drosophila kikkawai]
MIPVEKLFYLNAKTSGEAHSIVSNSPLTNDGFRSAWNNLSERFENKRALVSSKLKKLLNMQSIERESSAALKELQNTIQNCLTSLALSGLPTDNWDCLLVYLSSTKLPKLTLSLWGQSLTNKTDIPTNSIPSLLSAIELWKPSILSSLLRFASVHGASDIELQGSGWLTARPGCTIRNTLMTITTREATETKLQASYARFGDIDLTETVTKSSNTTNSIDVRTLNVNELLQRKMELFPKDTFRLPHSLAPIEHHHIAIYVGLIFVMIISIIHFVKKWQITQQNQRGHTTSATMATLATQPFTVNIDDC